MKFKKLLAGVLTGAMLVTSVIPAFAAEELAVQAEEVAGAEENGPVAEFNFEDSLDGATAVVTGFSDYSGNVTYDKNGRTGKAIKLGNYGLKLNKANLGTEYTVSAWVKADQALLNNQSCMFLGHNSPELWTAFAGTSSGIKLWANGNGQSWTEAWSGAFTANEWHHAVISGTDGKVSAYLDGVKVADNVTGNNSLSGEKQEIYLGVTAWTDDSYFPGSVDDVKVYDRQLSETEVFALYSTKTPAEVLQEEGISVPETMSVVAGKTKNIDVTMPSVVKAANPAVTYESSNPAVASVDDKGVVTGVKAAAEAVTITTKVALDGVEATGTTAVTVTEPQQGVDDRYAAAYDMSSADGKLVDVSGHGNDATMHNAQIIQEDGKDVLKLSAENQYVDLPISILDNLTDTNKFSVEVEYAKASDCPGTSWVWCFGSDRKNTGTNYLFYGYLNGGLRSGMKDNSNEKLFDTGVTHVADQYYLVTMVFDNGQLDLYIDGVRVKTGIDTGFDLMRDVVNNGCKNDILGHIGRSVWPDPYFRGKVKSFKIYDNAMNAQQIQEANKDRYEAALAKELDAITVDSILGNNKKADEVAYNLALPTTLGESTLAWSSKPAIIEGSGAVVNPEKDTEVTLTVTATSGALKASKDFKLTVKALDRAELDKLIKDAEAMDTSACEADSVAQLKAAIEAAKTANTQTLVDGNIAKLKRVISNLKYSEEVVNPFAFIEEPQTRMSVKAGAKVNLLTIPENIKDKVTVTYHSSDDKVVTYANGVVTAKAGGKASVTAIVTSNYNGYMVEYSTAFDVAGNAPTVDPHKGHEGKTFVAGGLKYKITKDNGKVQEARVTSLKNKKLKKLSIPSTVKCKELNETFKVTSVKSKAFKGTAVTSVVIGKNVTNIGPNAFLNCKKLKSVVIGKKVKTIGVRAFYGCKKLTKVTIKSTVLKNVKKNAFKQISKKAVIKVPKAKKMKYRRILKGRVAKGVKIK